MAVDCQIHCNCRKKKVFQVDRTIYPHPGKAGQKRALVIVRTEDWKVVHKVRPHGLVESMYLNAQKIFQSRCCREPSKS